MHKFWLWQYLGLVLVLLGVLTVVFWQSPESWVIKASLDGAKTDPFAAVLGTNVGDKPQAGLKDTLTHIAASLSVRTYAVTYAGSSWPFTVKDLGITLSPTATAERIWQLNHRSFGDKLRLLLTREHGRTVVEPVLTIDEQRCERVLKPVVAINRPAADAVLFFDNEIKIKPDVRGIVFNARTTCAAIASTVARGIYTTTALGDTIGAKVTQADYAAQLDHIRSMAGRPISFSYGGYIERIGTKTLLTYIVLSKIAGKPTQAAWSQAKLTALAATMATHIDTFTAPSLTACEELAAYGGRRLDRQSVIATIMALNATKPTTYTLKTYTARPVIRALKYLNGGKKGTVYLTYDDGMTYAQEIMDYAACFGIHVTFFEIGSLANSQVALLKEAIARGHAVQSHAYIHAEYDYGTGHSYQWQLDDIQHSIEVIQAITGRRPTYFRPPGGNHTPDTYKAAAANNIKLVLWDVSSIDTADIGTAQICANVVNGAYPGAAVLMHSIKLKTANALPCIAEGLAARGYNMQALW